MIRGNDEILGIHDMVVIQISHDVAAHHVPMGTQGGDIAAVDDAVQIGVAGNTWHRDAVNDHQVVGCHRLRRIARKV